MNDTKRHLLERLPGSFGLRNGHGFALGEHPSIATLPLCEPARAGEKRRIPGGTGVADTEVTCIKDDTDAWVWQEAGTGTGGVSLTAAWVMIGDETTFSAVSSVSLNSVFSSTYQNYAIVFNIDMSANAILDMRLRAAGTDQSAGTSYYSTSSWSANTLTLQNSGVGAGSTWLLGNAVGLASTRLIGELLIANPAVATETTMLTDIVGKYGTPGTVRHFGGNLHNLTTAYDGFTIYPASGTITGTIRVYGIQDSIGDGFTGYTDEAARDAIGAALVAGANTTITVDDAANTITIASTGGGSSSIADILMLGGM